MSRRARSLSDPADRERAALRYGLALDRGDLEAATEILGLAEQDPELVEMLLGIEEAHAAELDAGRSEELAGQVRDLLRTHLASGLRPPVASEVPPLTVSDVAARLQSAVALRGAADAELSRLLPQLHEARDPLPSELSLTSVRRLLSGLGLSVSRSFEKLFRESAIFLAMGRQRQLGALAAARRPRQRLRAPDAEPQRPELKEEDPHEPH